MAIATALTGTCQRAYVDSDYLGRIISASYDDAAPVLHRRGTGGTDFLAAGFFTPTGRINFYPTETSADFIKTTGGKIVRASSGYPCSDLTAFDVFFKSEVNTEVTDCKVTSFSLEGAVGDALTSTIEFMGLGVTEGGTAPTPTKALGSPFECNLATCSFGAGSGTPTGKYSLEGFSLTLANTLTPRSDMDGGATSPRMPKRLFVGDELVSLTLRTKNPIPSSVRGNLDDTVVTNLAFQGVFVNAAGTLTVDIDNMSCSSGQNSIETEDNVVIYSYSFEAQYCSQALTIAYTATP